MRFRPELTLASLLLPTVLFAQAAEFDRFATQAVKDWGAVGLAVTVVKDGKVVYAKGFGVRELGKPAAVDTNTLFAIGSTTKAMTAASLGMLVDEGKLRWDDRVIDHLPWFRLGDPYVTRELTIRDLLTHRGGLGNADYLWYRSDLSPHEVLRRMRFLQPAYSFRSSFIYQNLMYAAAGAVVEAASGMPWSQFIETRIFGPLGMTNSVTSLAKTAGHADVATPHDKVDGTIVPIENASVDAVAPAGAIWSSVADMGKWAMFMIDSGRVNGKRLLEPGTWAELFKPQTMVTLGEYYPTVQLTHPHWTTYGLGWFQQDYAGRQVEFHTGSIDGMVAIIGLIPDERLGVYVLGNLDHVEVRHALMLQAFDLWLGNGHRDWSHDLLALYRGLEARGDSARTRAEARRVPDTHPTLELAKYAGTYTAPDSLHGSVTVTYENGGLRLRTSSIRAGTLEHWDYDTFRVRWDDRWSGTAGARFVIGATGVPERLELGSGSYRRTGGDR